MCHLDQPGPYVMVDWDSYKTGVGLPPHKSQKFLHSPCMFPPKGNAFLGGAMATMYKLQPHPGVGHNRAYFKVKKAMWDGHNDRDFYLHDMLCYMFHGPPPDPTLVVGHLCGNKLCCCPWHLYWIPQSDNVKMGWNKKKRKWVY